MEKILCGLIISAVVLYGCSNSPSDDEIKRCVLKEYDCGNYARINSIKVVNSRKIKDFMGQEEYEVYVDGEIEWTNDCQSFLQTIQAGHKERFLNKAIVMAKMDKGWGCP